MNSPEFRRGIGRTQDFDPSRRNFLKAALGGLAMAGLGSFGLWAIAESNKKQESAFLTDDQKAARDFLVAARKAQETIEVTVVNSQDPGEPVKVRQNPAKLYDNLLTEVKPAEQFEAILVGPVHGLQQTDPKLGGPWVAVEIDKATGKIGFINGHFIERTDGQPLAAGQKIYDLRPNEADILSPLDQ